MPTPSLVLKLLVFVAFAGLTGWLLRELYEQLWIKVAGPRVVTVVVSAVLLVLAATWLQRHLARLHAMLDSYAQRLGIDVPKPRRGDALQRLESRVRRFSEAVVAETSALEYQALHDSLTRLPNRILLLERLDAALQHAPDQVRPLALLIMDLDHFKEINDTLGHRTGDRLLQQIGPRLLSVLGPGDSVARLGGDEFAVLLAGADGARSRAVCRAILTVLEPPMKVDDLRLRVGISIGVAQYPEHGEDASLLMQHADIAMYDAKRRHQGYAFFTPADEGRAPSRLGLSAELGEAITDNQLTLVYQPLVDVKTGRVYCAETLVRWRHPRHGLIMPEQFIPAAEQSGAIRPLTLWVIDQALAQIKRWSAIGLDLGISINLSARSLQDRGLPSQVQRLVDRHQADPRRVILEITESALLSDPLTARRVMRRLSQTGFRLSIDDFGTGYSSLTYLKQLPVDEIKIDKSFVSHMDQDDSDAAIVRATIDLAHSLGLKVVAEGVESQGVWNLLEALGCDIAQGYLIRRPLTPQALVEWISSRECARGRSAGSLCVLS
jgi:diguanylate cyclase (GGDEF)-like protein